MSTRTRTATAENEQDLLYDDETLDLEALSDDELEAILFEDEPQKPTGMFNLPTLTGLSLILVGIAYFFQQMGLWSAGIDLTVLAQMLPWLAGVLIILLGFGVLSWRPGRNRKREKAEKKLAKSQLRSEKSRGAKVGKSGRKSGRKLMKSQDKKLAGVGIRVGRILWYRPDTGPHWICDRNDRIGWWAFSFRLHHPGICNAKSGKST